MSSNTHNIFELWNAALGEIEKNVSKANFVTWFKKAHLLKVEDGTAFIGVPNQFVRDWLSTKHTLFILKILRNMSQNIRSVSFSISKEAPQQEQAHIATNSVQNVGSVLPLHDVYVNKEDNLNPRYQFNTFIVGGFNELAHAAAQAVIEKPGRSYNPLFIYGKTGHGKTHLIQAIGNEIKKQKEEMHVYYITSEKFTQDLINSFKTNKTDAFKTKLRKYDVLIMDDIQFISGKEKTQEELFHIFNALYNDNKQIVFSSDQHPNYIPGLEERLKSRFSAGMTVDIPAPDKESRIAILQTKITQHGITIASDILEHIAGTVDGNIRELEGALNSILMYSQLKKREVTLSEAREILKNNIKPKKAIPVEEVVQKIAEFYNVEPESIYKKTRKKEVVKPRQLIIYILREDFSIAYPTIGEKIGGRDHTTAIHSYEKIKKELETDHSLQQEVQQIRTLF
jgi:chromosomal replication initiator protein